MPTPNIVANLRNTLAELYDDIASIRRVAGDAGLTLARVVLSSSAINNWQAVLSEAERTSKVEVLLAVVLGEYGMNQKLRQAADDYQAAAEQGDTSEKTSSPTSSQVNTGGGDFTGHDKTTHGDDIGRDKAGRDIYKFSEPITFNPSSQEKVLAISDKLSDSDESKGTSKPDKVVEPEPTKPISLWTRQSIRIFVPLLLVVLVVISTRSYWRSLITQPNVTTPMPSALPTSLSFTTVPPTAMALPTEQINAGILNGTATAKYNKEDYQGAIADYTEAIRLDPNYAKSYTNRGRAYDKQSKYDLALADYNKSITLAPNYPFAYDGRGLLYMHQGKYDLALADYTEAIRLDPNYTTAYFDRGYAYRQQDKYDLAIADYTEAIALDPANADTYIGRGIAYRQQDKYDLAITDYTKAIALDPNNADAYYNRGYAYKYQDNKTAALPDFQKAADLYQQQGSASDQQDALNEIKALQK